MSVQVITAEMLARNQFKINGTGEAPTIYSGSMGTYDSATDSYYFSSNCGMDWKNWSDIGMTLEKAQRLTKIEFEWEGQIRNTSYGQSFDAQMQTYFNTNLLFINGIADGYYDAGSDYQKFARIKNGGSDQWETTEQVPFNNSQYQNAFHKVKWIWEIENSVAKELTVYLDGNLFCHYSGTLYSFSITALGTNILRFATIDHTNVKSVKIAFYHNPVTPSGGAGSGYIGNSLLSNKKMVGYNVPTSEAESTKTESVSEVSASAVSGKPKIGNGFVRIKFLQNVHQYSFDDILKNTDLTHLKQSTNAYPTSRAGYIPDSLLQYVGSDWILNCSENSGIATLERNNSEYVWTSVVDSNSFDFFPIKQEYIGKDLMKIKMKVMLTSTQGQINDVTNVLYFDYNWDISHHNIDSLNTWYEIEVDLRGKTMTDYLRLFCQSGVWKFKDISIYMVSD